MKSIPWLFLLVTSLFYLLFFVRQEDFFAITASYSIAFLSYLFLSGQLIKFTKPEVVLWFGLILRVITLIAFPDLSDDVYRYYWDGKLFIEGINPFQCAPIEAQEIYKFSELSMKNALEKMNSSEYMTVYPSLCQLLFGLSALLSLGNIEIFSVILKLLLLLLEILIIKKLILKKKGDDNLLQVFTLYFINPLIIVESYGNLHFELLMGLLFILSIYQLFEEKYDQSWLAFGLSIITKIYTLILLPVIILKGRIKSLKWIWIFLLLILSQILFVGINFQNIKGYSLYFKQFEFNSSLFILLSKILIYLEKPELWNYRGLILNVCWIIFASLYLLFNRNKLKALNGIFESCFVMYGTFLLCHSTLHPWYVITLVLLGLFNHPLTSIWISFVFTLSYIHYSVQYYSYLTLIQIIEYCSIFVIYSYERRNPDFYKSRFLKTKPITTLFLE